MKTSKNRNLGIETLRAISCFWVIIFHCHNNANKIAKFIISKRYHVPCFFIISFFFLYPVVFSKNVDKMKQRLEKLLITYIVWILILWILSEWPLILSNKILYALNDLKIQIIIGRKFMGHLWFMFILIFFNIFFFIITFFLRANNFLFALLVVSIVSYIFQYSGYNYISFEKYSKLIRYSVGYFIEIIPFVTSGFLLAILNIEKYLKKYRKKALIFIFMFLFFTFKYSVFSKAYGFNFQGIDKSIISSFLFIAFYLFPFEKLKSNFINNLVIFCTRFTQGIYYLHLFLDQKISFILNIKNTLLKCFLIYFIGYSISFIGSKIAGKSIFKYMF